MNMFLTVLLALAVSVSAAPKADAAWCPTCVQFMGEALDELLNIILNAGVIGTCGELCSQLSNNIEAEVCSVLCDIVGVEGFIHLLDDIDPSPIFYCEELGVCPISDNAKANIRSLTVSPQSGPQGTTFSIDVIYQVTSMIGTGEISLLVAPPDGMPFGDGALLVDVKPDTYRAAFSLKAQPSEQEPFQPGQYVVQIALCEGSCGSIHAHAYTLAVSNTTFSITQ